MPPLSVWRCDLDAYGDWGGDTGAITMRRAGLTNNSTALYNFSTASWSTAGFTMNNKQASHLSVIPWP